MKLQSKTNKTHGFTLIEMIGVLAVIAILAALLIPKVFQAINEAKINTVPVAAGTIKTAVVDHYAKYGALNVMKNTAATPTDATPVAVTFTSGLCADYDGTVLMKEGFIEKPFNVRVGKTADIEAAELPSTAVTAVTAGNGTTFDLDNSGAAAGNDVVGSHVVYAVIKEVPFADAQAISARMDGPTMSQPEGSTSSDLAGRVKYGATATTGGVGADLYIYLTHR